VPLAIWPWAWSAVAVPTANVKPRRTFMTVMVGRVVRVSVDREMLFMAFPLMFSALVSAKNIPLSFMGCARWKKVPHKTILRKRKLLAPPEIMVAACLSGSRSGWSARRVDS
jgi:hypothetical protein